MTKDAGGIRGKRTLPGRPPTRSEEAAGNRTATIGLDVLQAIARMRGPATLTEIAQALGMSVSTTSRYLASLSLAEFIDQDQETGKYDLGPAAIELGAAAMARVDAVRLATDLMRGLTARTRLVSILAVWGRNGPTLIRWEQGFNDLPIRVREGLGLSLVATAVGRIFLAYHDAGELKPVLQHDLKEWNATAAAAQRFNLKGMDEIKREIRHAGLAFAAGINNPVLAAIAAPVFGQERRLVLSLGLAGIIGTFDASATGEAAQALAQAATRLSRMIGGGADA